MSLLIFTISFFFQSEKTSSLDYQLFKNTTNPEVTDDIWKDMVVSNYKEKGIKLYSGDTNGKTYVLIAYGETSQNNISINVSSVEATNSTVLITAEYEANGRYSEGLFYPYSILEIPFIGEKEIILQGIDLNEPIPEIQEEIISFIDALIISPNKARITHKNKEDIDLKTSLSYPNGTFVTLEIGEENEILNISPYEKIKEFAEVVNIDGNTIDLKLEGKIISYSTDDLAILELKPKDSAYFTFYYDYSDNSVKVVL